MSCCRAGVWDKEFWDPDGIDPGGGVKLCPEKLLCDPKDRLGCNSCMTLVGSEPAEAA